MNKVKKTPKTTELILHCYCWVLRNSETRENISTFLVHMNVEPTHGKFSGKEIACCFPFQDGKADR